MELITGVAALLTEIFKLVNTKEGNKYLDQVTKLRLQIKEEESKANDQDSDERVTYLREQLQVLSDAAREQLILWQSQKSS